MMESTVEVSIKLEGDCREYRPGDTITGTVTARAQESWQALCLDVVAGWSTTGRGDSDSAGEVTLRLLEDGDSAPPRFERRFDLKLPPMPWSYPGKLLKISWTIGVYAKPYGGRETHDELSITVHPRAGGMLPTAPADAYYEDGEGLEE